MTTNSGSEMHPLTHSEGEHVIEGDGVSITLNVPEEDQESSFMNATLQGVGSLAVSIATHIKLPRTDMTNEEILAFIKAACEVAHEESYGALNFEVQIGPSR